MNRKGISLSINMVVVIILGIVLIGIGLFLITTITNDLNTINRDIDEQLKGDLVRLRFRDEQVVGLLNTHETVSRGKDAWYLLGFVNELNEEKKFRIVTEYVDDSPVHDEFQGTQYYQDNTPEYLVFHKFRENSALTVTLKTNEREFMWLLADIPKNIPRGDYMYNIYVCVEADPSDIPPGDICSTQGAFKTYTGQKQRMYIHVS